MRRLGLIITVLLLPALLTVAGCGYRPLNSSVIPGATTVKSIYVPVFVNRSFKPALEAFLANSITEEFARRRGEWRIGGEESDYILSGTILSYERPAVAYTSVDTVAEYRASLTAEITLRKNGSRQLIRKWNLSLFQDFPANTDVAFQQNSEDTAIQEVCRKLSQAIYVGLADDF